jgi:S-adenosylmethionine decarboxylase
MGETFGLHLMVDGYGCDPSRLNDKDFIHRFLDEFPEDIGMTKLMSPYVASYTEDDRGLTGLSGFVLIAESHVSIHTFPLEGYVSIDVFSCKPFDTVAAEREIARKFGMTRMECNILDRGLEYPATPGAAMAVVDTERQRRGPESSGA